MGQVEGLLHMGLTSDGTELSYTETEAFSDETSNHLHPGWPGRESSKKKMQIPGFHTSLDQSQPLRVGFRICVFHELPA